MTPTALTLARTLVQQFEGCRLAPYRDSAGIATMGWGATTWAAKPTTMATPPITQAEADAALAATLDAVAARVDALVHVALTDGQAAALVSLAYNIGTGALRDSTLLRLLNGGDAAGASSQFMVWVRASGRIVEGLVARRAAERAVFDGAEAPANPAENMQNLCASAAGIPASEQNQSATTDFLNNAELARIAGTEGTTP